MSTHGLRGGNQHHRQPKPCFRDLLGIRQRTECYHSNQLPSREPQTHSTKRWFAFSGLRNLTATTWLRIKILGMESGLENRYSPQLKGRKDFFHSLIHLLTHENDQILRGRTMYRVQVLTPTSCQLSPAPIHSHFQATACLQRVQKEGANRKAYLQVFLI